ncbi:hypothetical protein L3N51_01922 [Metallosphaera sp. J1]|uniref:hypothetical protein n=1 Tax=Metallosphaera javensis (ex Hofmann et al. 2022) TaxID=99938 RepID=UPI001EDCFE12|nr:hypothetical protein [Metallosphaera javensis (ex Hofmann et al. 2022)]MCG3109627.1 hypothetical protein [Metallosphaera javensis (ex Hofmann et al. 2022)]
MGDGLLNASNDFLVLILGVIISILFFIYERRISQGSPKTFLDISTVLSAIGPVLKLMPVGVLEVGNAFDLGDDYPAIIILIMFILD